MAPAPHLIAIGEALVEIMRPDKRTPLDREGLFRGPYASGAPAIFAVAAARLGLSAGFIGSVGADAFGRLIARRLRDEQVDTSLLQHSSGMTTGTAFVAYAADGGREFVFHLPQSAAAELNAGQISAGYFSSVSWLHISGSTLFLSESCRQACARALLLTREAGGNVSLDPNLRPELMAVDEARTVLAPYLETADLLLPTAEEAMLLSGTGEEEAAAQALLDEKDRLVVLKRGALGAVVFGADSRSDIPGFSVGEVDPTGAGDCFNAAFIYGLQQGWPAPKAGLFAAAAGALAVTRQGPMEGAPTSEEAQEFLRSARLST